MKIKLFIFFIFFFTSLNLYSEIYFVNLNTLLNESKVGIEINKEINSVETKNLDILNNLKLDIEKDQQNLEKQKNLISDDEYDQFLKIINAKIIEYNQKLKNSNDYINNLKTTYKNNFFNLLEPLLDKYVKEKKISYLLQKNLAIYVDKKYDITNQIIIIIDNEINFKKIR